MRTSISQMKKTLTSIGIIVLAALLCFGAGAVWSRRDTGVKKVTTDLISERLTNISELATVEYHYTNMGKFEESTDFYGWKVPFTKKGFIISYDGVIKAGIDTDGLGVNVNGKRIVITLPEARILSHTIDENSIEVFDESKNIFNPIRITDYTQFSKDQKTKTEEKAIEKGLLEEAKQKAKNAVSDFLQIAPGMNEYEITFD